MKGCNLNNFNLILVLIIIIIVISMIYKYEKFQSSCKADKLPKHSNNSNNRNNITINSPYIYSSNNDKDKIIKLQGSGLDSNNIPFGTSEELYAELAEGDELTGRILASYKKARTDIGGWLNIADTGYSTQRRRVLEG